MYWTRCFRNGFNSKARSVFDRLGRRIDLSDPAREAPAIYKEAQAQRRDLQPATARRGTGATAKSERSAMTTAAGLAAEVRAL